MEREWMIDKNNTAIFTNYFFLSKHTFKYVHHASFEFDRRHSNTVFILIFFNLLQSSFNSTLSYDLEDQWTWKEPWVCVYCIFNNWCDICHYEKTTLTPSFRSTANQWCTYTILNLFLISSSKFTFPRFSTNWACNVKINKFICIMIYN